MKVKVRVRVRVRVRLYPVFPFFGVQPVLA